MGFEREMEDGDGLAEGDGLGEGDGFAEGEGFGSLGREMGWGG